MSADGAPVPVDVWRWLVAASAIGAGLIHAGASGANRRHGLLAALFVAAAVGLCAIGVVVARGAVVRRVSRGVALAGACGAAAVATTWVLSCAVGVPFVPGLETRREVGFAGLVAFALEVLVAAGLVRLRRLTTGRPAAVVALPGISSLTVIAVGMMSVPAIVQTVRDPAAVTAESGHSHTHVTGHSGPLLGGAEGGIGVAVPFDPTKPVDLGGVAGVSSDDRRRAERLLAATIEALPRYATVTSAEAEGYEPVDAARNGFRYYLNTARLDDGITLDARIPEGLLYRIGADGASTLLAALFVLEPGASLDTAPNVGGALTQWHERADVPAPAMEVWVTPSRCGPFSSPDDGVTRTVPVGESRLCDTAHGA